MKYILFAICMHCFAAATPQQKKEKPLQVLLLGTFHFDNPGLDVAKFKDADILSPKRQQEVKEVTRLLQQFAPDKIFIEAPPAQQPQTDSAFTLYKNGKKELNPSEVEQLGFRLAQQLGLPTVYGVDYREASFPFDSLMKAATAARQAGLVSFVQQTIENVQRSFNEALQRSTIKEMLLRENSEGLTRLQHELYNKLIPAGKQGDNVGAYLVSEWWRRNMVIYANMLKQLNGHEQKVLIIFGSGHTAILSELMKFNSSVKLVKVAEVLGAMQPK